MIILYHKISKIYAKVLNTFIIIDYYRSKGWIWKFIVSNEILQVYLLHCCHEPRCWLYFLIYRCWLCFLICRCWLCFLIYQHSRYMAEIMPIRRRTLSNQSYIYQHNNNCKIYQKWKRSLLLLKSQIFVFNLLTCAFESLMIGIMRGLRTIPSSKVSRLFWTHVPLVQTAKERLRYTLRCFWWCF